VETTIDLPSDCLSKPFLLVLVIVGFPLSAGNFCNLLASFSMWTKNWAGKGPGMRLAICTPPILIACWSNTSTPGENACWVQTHKSSHLPTVWAPGNKLSYTSFSECFMYTFATSLTAEIDKCTWDINIHSGNAHFHVITHYVLSVSSNLQRSLVENFKVHKFYRLAIAVYNLCLLLILSLQLSRYRCWWSWQCWALCRQVCV